MSRGKTRVWELAIALERTVIVLAQYKRALNLSALCVFLRNTRERLILQRKWKSVKKPKLRKRQPRRRQLWVEVEAEEGEVVDVAEVVRRERQHHEVVRPGRDRPDLSSCRIQALTRMVMVLRRRRHKQEAQLLLLPWTPQVRLYAVLSLVNRLYDIRLL